MSEALTLIEKIKIKIKEIDNDISILLKNQKIGGESKTKRDDRSDPK
jgi:hypothetical protein